MKDTREQNDPMMHGEADGCCEHDHKHEHHEEADGCCCGHDHKHEHHEEADGCCCEHDHKHGHHEEADGCCCGHDHKHGHHEESACCCGHDHEHGHDEEDGCCCCGHDHDGDSAQSRKQLVWRYGLGALPILLGFLPFLPTPLRVAASVVGYLLFGASVWKEMLRSMRRKRIFTEFTLMCVASVGAFLIGEYADAAAVMYLYSLGEVLSGQAYAGSKRNISELLEILPEYAVVLRNGEAQRVTPQEVSVGETILVTAGERIPLDGFVIDGGGNADTSSVTGESKPLELYEGVFCPSGAVLHDGSVQLRVSEQYEDSVVSKLSDAVREASARKSASEKKIARFARVFTPCAFGFAALVCLVGTVISGNFVEWLRMGLIVLVVSCPCSLVLSVPLTYFAGIGYAASRGIVFRGGEVMDAMGRLRAVALDKTGTVTESGLHFDGAEVYGVTDREEFLSLAYDVLLHSPHAAAVSYCREYEGSAVRTVSQVEILGGRGIVCMVDGRQAAFGNAALMRAMGIEQADSPTTAIFGEVDGVLLGKLRFSSRLKEGSRQAIEELKAGGITRICMLSGDGAEAVAHACAEARIDEYDAALTPAQKAERFAQIAKEEKAAHRRATVAFCGDGLNDSAVIAGADVGIAMGGCGSALTVRSADVVLMDDDLRKLGEALRIAKRTARIAEQNIWLSLGMKAAVTLCAMILSVCFHTEIPMGLAIVADVGAALLAVLNAVRAGRG